MWVALRQEELRRMTKTGSSGKGAQVKKEEEEDAELASSRQQGQQKRKKDITKVRCFNIGELGHYATQCPQKKGKGEASESKVAPAKANNEGEDDDCVRILHITEQWNT